MRMRTGALRGRTLKCTLQDGFDFGVDGDVGGGEAVDGMALGAGLFGEMEETADVVVLVEAGKEAFRLFDRKTKFCNGDGIAEGVDELAVEVCEFF